MKQPRWTDEPDDHGIGRSRGGLTSKAHVLVDGTGKPLVVAVTPGQAADTTALPRLLAQLRVARPGPGRPRTRPEALVADKAYSTRAHRAALRGRGIRVVVPERADQVANRKRRGRAGGRPPAFDARAYRGRNVVERTFSHLKQWRGLATRYDKYATTWRGGLVLASIVLWLKR